MATASDSITTGGEHTPNPTQPNPCPSPNRGELGPTFLCTTTLHLPCLQLQDEATQVLQQIPNKSVEMTARPDCTVQMIFREFFCTIRGVSSVQTSITRLRKLSGAELHLRRGRVRRGTLPPLPIACSNRYIGRFVGVGTHLGWRVLPPSPMRPHFAAGRPDSCDGVRNSKGLPCGSLCPQTTNFPTIK